jgi:protein-S-isoprenylcysteine O-methyltransferase Ste14
MMDANMWMLWFHDFRFVIAVLLWMAFPPAFVFWYSVHGFYPLWQKLGVAVTYTVNLIFVALLMAILFNYKDVLVMADLGFYPILTFLGIVIWLICWRIEKYTHAQLSFKMLVGVPEIDPHHPHSKLLTEGIFSRVRNPRYLTLILSVLGWAFFSNYAGMYVLLLVVIVMIYLVVLLEERELKHRFGDEYAAYCERVPRFVPKLF